jgi:hypothetical protein
VKIAPLFVTLLVAVSTAGPCFADQKSDQAPSQSSKKSDSIPEKPKATSRHAWQPPQVQPLPPFRHDAAGREFWTDHDPRTAAQREAWKIFTDPKTQEQKIWASRLTDDVVEALRPKVILSFPAGEASATADAINQAMGAPHNVPLGANAPHVSFPVDWHDH